MPVASRAAHCRDDRKRPELHRTSAPGRTSALISGEGTLGSGPIRQGEEGTAVADICRQAGISQATYFNWKKRYGGLMPSEMRRLRDLEEENGRLKRIVADLSLDKEMLQDVIKRKL